MTGLAFGLVVRTSRSEDGINFLEFILKSMEVIDI